jgi:hypothetical protein
VPRGALLSVSPTWVLLTTVITGAVAASLVWAVTCAPATHGSRICDGLGAAAVLKDTRARRGVLPPDGRLTRCPCFSAAIDRTPAPFPHYFMSSALVLARTGSSFAVSHPPMPCGGQFQTCIDPDTDRVQSLQCAQQARAMDLEARHRRLHMYLADCATHRADQQGGPGA